MRDEIRRRICIAAALAPLARMSHAQSMPSVIRILVGYPAGAAYDLYARLVATRMAHTLKTSVVVENVQGANGTLAQNKVLSSLADGSVILLGGTNEVLADVYAGSRRLAQALTSLGGIAYTPLVLVGRPGLAAQNTEELVRLAGAPGSR